MRTNPTNLRDRRFGAQERLEARIKLLKSGNSIRREDRWFPFTTMGETLSEEEIATKLEIAENDLANLNRNISGHRS